MLCGARFVICNCLMPPNNKKEENAMDILLKINI
jgi:hypothetical protein